MTVFIFTFKIERRTSETIIKEWGCRRAYQLQFQLTKNNRKQRVRNNNKENRQHYASGGVFAETVGVAFDLHALETPNARNN